MPRKVSTESRGHARSEGLILVTNKLRELERVEALRLENWL